MNRIQVIRTSGDLSRSVWWFWFYGERKTLYVDAYFEESRPTKRHKFRIDKIYSRIDGRSNTITAPPLPDDVAAEALETLRDQISVKLWADR